ncbi:MAG: pentapeptide repeat-containing protein [Aulosira sp. ZfuVER01]|nr:pentapeptide repeat-containing protein [Aulosira sp. ZfuVER01]MDZ7998397.1 pentapeptide repeat-containing protein [Aulosira sp. DedVER01a]MDZ8050174.1 pentapeptide repeat-containing protein [Aulosira sp. ZfuCHP01]
MNNSNNIKNFNFTACSITNKNFQNARAGHILHKTILIVTIGIIISLFCGILPVVSANSLVIIIDNLIKKPNLIIFIVINIILYFYSLFFIVNRGFKVIAFTFIISLIIIGTIATSFLRYQNSNYISQLLIQTLFLGLSIVFAWLGVITTAFTITFNYLFLGRLAEVITSFEAIITASILAAWSQDISQSIYAKIIIIFISIILIIIGAIISRLTLKNSGNFYWIREKVVFWAATGGTSFYGADLTDACFDGADLRHTDFRKANLTRASFKDVTGLELARLQGTILEDSRVRKLLTTKNGQGEDFTEANLQGANLQGADLREAILVKAQVLDADFSGAFLTDSCIQNWNINHNTRFQNVDCQRVYLKRSLHGHFLEPKPDSGEFKPGEFEKWITDVRDTIDLIFQNGLNWRAFAFSLTQTAINNEGLGLSVRSIENKGDGVVVAKVGVSLETNKNAIHEEITTHYHQAVQAIEAKYELVLQAKEGEIQRLKTFHDSQQKFIQGLITGIAETKREVIIKGEGNRVYMMNQAGDIMESNNQSIRAGGDVDMSSGNKITVGGDVTNSNLTLADANSQVSNSIQQLRDISTETSDQLAKILTTLQKSITDDSALSDSQKKEALEAVETIAEEGKKPPGERVLKLCSLAVNALKGVTSAITDTSKLAEVFKTYLPTITSLLGL